MESDFDDIGMQGLWQTLTKMVSLESFTLDLNDKPISKPLSPMKETYLSIFRNQELKSNAQITFTIEEFTPEI